MIKQPFGGVVRDIAPEGDGRGTTLEVGGEVSISGIVVVEQESPVVVGQPQKRMEGVHSAFAPLKRLLRLGGGFWQEWFPVPLVPGREVFVWIISGERTVPVGNVAFPANRVHPSLRHGKQWRMSV